MPCRSGRIPRARNIARLSSRPNEGTWQQARCCGYLLPIDTRTSSAHFVRIRRCTSSPFFDRQRADRDDRDLCRASSRIHIVAGSITGTLHSCQVSSRVVRQADALCHPCGRRRGRGRASRGHLCRSVDSRRNGDAQARCLANSFLRVCTSSAAGMARASGAPCPAHCAPKPCSPHALAAACRAFPAS